MSKPIVVILAGQKYECPLFTLGELEKVAELTSDMPATKTGFAILKMALAKAEPPVTDPDKIEARGDELQAAIDAVLVGAGLKAVSGEAKPATAA